MKIKNPEVSVCIITFNQSKFISKAIESVLSQKTTFNFNVFIADDFSTDGTREIVIEYFQKYPEIINLLLRDSRVGAAINWIELLNQPNSKYISYLEGDDYWVDDFKLQKQFEILENQEDIVLCGTKSILEYVNTNSLVRQSNIYSGEVVATEELLKKWAIMSSSIFFRSSILKKVIDYLPKYKIGDWPLIILFSLHGNIFCIDQFLIVYRQNVPESYNNKTSTLRMYESIYDMYEKINLDTLYLYSKIIQTQKAIYLLELARLQSGIKGIFRKFKLIFMAAKSDLKFVSGRVNYILFTIVLPVSDYFLFRKLRLK